MAKKMFIWKNYSGGNFDFSRDYHFPSLFGADKMQNLLIIAKMNTKVSFFNWKFFCH